MSMNPSDDVRDVVKEFIFNESDKKLEIFIKEIVDKIVSGEVEPLDAYTEFFKKIEELFPEISENILLKESMIQRFQLYMQIRILAKLNEKKIRGKINKN